MTDDGLPDIVTNYGLMLPGTGQGSFGPAEEFAWFWGHSAAADMDLDGDLDLVATNSRSVEILNNQRTAANQIPVADAGGNRTWSYTYQFEAGEFALSGADSSDPDMHLLSYEWREDGEVIDAWPGEATGCPVSTISSSSSATGAAARRGRRSLGPSHTSRRS